MLTSREGSNAMPAFRLLACSGLSWLLPPEKRGLALGAGTAAGSFGQFLFAPFGVAMIDNFGWQAALTVFAFLMLLIVPLSIPALIFGAGAVSAVDAGQSVQGHFSLLGALLIFTTLCAPVATSFALRIALE